MTESIRQSAVRLHQKSAAVGESANIWRSTDYPCWFGADTADTLAAGITSFALSLIVFDITESAAEATMVESLYVVMQALTSIPGGLLQDRFDRRRLLLIYGASGLLLTGIAALAGMVGTLTVGLLIVLAASLGVRAGLLANTSNAMLRGIVSDSDLPKALAANNGRDAVVNILGSPLSGFLMRAGNAIPFAASAVMNAIGVIFTLRIRHYWHHDDACNTDDETTQQTAQHAMTCRALCRDAFAGFAWMLSHDMQRRLLTISILFNGAVNALLLLMQLDIMRRTGSPVTAAAVITVGSVGMLLGAALSGLLMKRFDSGMLICAAFALMACGSFGMVVLPGIVEQGFALFAGLLFVPVGNAILGGFQTLLIGKRNQGRVSAVGTLCNLGSYAAMSAIAGPLMEMMGFVRAGLVFAVILAVATILLIQTSTLRDLPKPDQWQSYIDDRSIDCWI